MLAKAARKELRELHARIRERVIELEERMAWGKLTPWDVDKKLSEEFGPDYGDVLEEADSILAQDRRQRILAVTIPVIIIALIPVLLIAGGFTGFLTAFVDSPTTLTVEQAFTSETVFIPDINRNISSLRATGTFIGNGTFRIVHIDNAGSERTLYAHEAFVPENGTLLGSTARKVAFTGKCADTCLLNQSAGPHLLRIEVEGGTLNLSSITFTERVETAISEEQAGEAVVVEETISVPQQPTPPDNSPGPDTEPPINETPARNETQTLPADKPAKPGNDTIKPEKPTVPTYPELTARGRLQVPPGMSRAQELSVRKQRFRSLGHSQAPPEYVLPAVARERVPPQSVISDEGMVPIKTRAHYIRGENMTPAPNESRGTPYIMPNAAFKLTSEYMNTELPYILQIDPEAELPPGLDAERYGGLVFARLTLKELFTLYPSDDSSPMTFATFDNEVQVQAITVDTHIQAQIVRNSTGLAGRTGVCVIDSGIDKALFPDNYVGGTDFIEQDADPDDDSGHGTRMADMITTIAPGASLYVAKVLNASGHGRASDVIKAIDWCMTQDVEVISMSLGGGYAISWCDSDPLAQKANEAVARGFFVVAGAGNEGYSTMPSPACASMVTSVAATQDHETNETVWIDTNLNGVTDLLAPGVGVALRGPQGIVAEVSGTSISTAATAGAAAILAENSSSAASSIQYLLRSTGEPVEARGTFRPRIDVLRAYNNETNGLDLTQDGYQTDLQGGDGVAQQPLGDCQDEGATCWNGWQYTDSWCTQDGCLDGSTVCTFLGCTAYSNKCTYAQSSCSGTESNMCDWQSNPGTCSNRCTGTTGIDNDGDGLTDGCDSDCGLSVCTTGTCCDTTYCQYSSGATECRGSAGTCDIAEYCTGTSNTCPGDAKSTALCRGSAGTCDVAEYCDGSSNTCPNDAYTSGSLCRGSGGVCDVAEYCDGGGPNCPTDTFVSSATVCSTGSWSCSGSCEIVRANQYCPGNAASCTGSVLQEWDVIPYGQVCSGGGGVAANCYDNCGSSGPNQCSGQQPVETAYACNGGGACTIAWSTCTYGSSCSGAESNYCAGGSCSNRCSNGVDDDGDGFTDGQDTDCGGCGACNSGTCCNTANGCFQSSATQCRGSAGTCDIAEYCTGTSSTCPGDAKSTALCRGSAGTCDVAEYCDGSSNTCPGDSFVSSATICSTGSWSCSGSCQTVRTNTYCPGNAASCSGSAVPEYSNIAAYKVCSGANAVDATSTALSCDGSIDYFASENACTYTGRYAECNGAGTCDSASGTYYQSAGTFNVPAGNVANAQSGGAGLPYSALSCSNYCGTSGSSYCSGENYVINRQACGGAGTCNGGTTACTTSAVTSNGAVCACNGQCNSGLCDDNVYQGGVEAERCKPDASYCVTDASSPYYYAGTGSVVGDSACYGSVSGGSVWLSTSGRYEIENTGATTLGVIDKYGSMGVRGAVSGSAATTGYKVANTGGTSMVTIDSTTGALYRAGSTTERTTPSGTGVHVQNTVGTVQAVLSSTGNILLRGDIAYSLTSLT